MSFQQFCDKRLKEITVNKPPIDMELFELMLKCCDKDEGLCIRSRKLVCIPCFKTFENFNTKNGNSWVNEHLKTDKHKNNISTHSNKRKSSEDLSIIGKSAREKKENFAKDLTTAFMSADIPLCKLDNEVLRRFLFDYTDQTIPKPETLRLRYVNDVYDKKLEKVSDLIANKNVYVMVDETTDSAQRSVFNVLVGVMNGEISKPILISTQFLKETTGKAISEATIKACKDIGIKFQNVKLCLTDVAPSMILAMRLTKEKFTQMRHITCLAHTLHRVCEKIRSNNLLADSFISKMKKTFTNSPKIRRQFKEICKIPLPNSPVITRWGTWLEAAFYYCENFDVICEFINKLVAKNEAIVELKELLFNPNLRIQITRLIKFKCLTQNIIEIQKQSLPVRDQMKIIKNLQQILSGFSLKKLNECLSKNPDLKLFIDNLTPEEFYAPLTTVDVERSFSIYKSLLTDRRMRFSDDNLKKFFFVKFNQFI